MEYIGCVRCQKFKTCMHTAHHPASFASLRGCLLLMLMLALGSAAALAAAPAPESSLAASLSRADRTAIRTVISSQLKALVAEDDSAAFAMSAPDVRRQFGTAQAFGEMVREGYPALLRNQSTAFLEASVIDEDVIQPLRIITRDGGVVIAFFSMQRQSNGDWRVYGCEIAPSALRAA
jgi:hypothetical protein